MIQTENIFKVNGKLVIADTIENAIRIYKTYYKMQNMSDTVNVVEKLDEFSTVILRSSTALYETETRL